MAHDRMKMEAKHPKVENRAPRLHEGRLAFKGIDGRPGMDDSIGMALLHRGNKIVRTGRRVDRRLKIQRHENCLDARVREFLNDLFFLFWKPRAIPIGGQRIDVGLLAGDPLARVWVAMKVNNSHAIFRLPAFARFSLQRLPCPRALPPFSLRSFPSAISWKPCRMGRAGNPA